jgi:hypothetical protein
LSIQISNSAGDNNGGAVVVQEGANFEVEFSTFRENAALIGGAIFAQDSTVKVKQSTFSRNKASAAVSTFIVVQACLMYEKTGKTQPTACCLFTSTREEP